MCKNENLFDKRVIVFLLFWLAVIEAYSNQFSNKRTDDEKRTAVHAGYRIIYYNNTVFYGFIRRFSAENFKFKNTRTQ